MRNKWILGVVALTAALLLLPAAAASASGSFWHHPVWHSGLPGTAVVSVEQGPYGPVLVVGGAGAGYIPGTGYAYPAGSSLYLRDDRSAHLWVLLVPPVPAGLHNHGGRQRGGGTAVLHRT